MNLPLAFAVSSKDKRILKSSSSGGVFYHLAHYYITELKGVVYGAQMIGKNVEHARIDNVDNLDLILKSKYSVSSMKNCFEKCLEDLNNGFNVLFSGTPCQISGLISFLDYKKIKRDNLLTIDLVCHGVPNSKYLDIYLRTEFPTEVVKNIDFRCKNPSWEDYSLKIVTNKRTIVSPYYRDDYMNAFLKNYSLLESCYKCLHKGLNRVADVTLGDFWGVKNYYPELYNKYGVSLLILNNQKKLQTITFSLSNCTINEVDLGVATYCNPSYFVCAKKPDNHLEIVKEMENGTFPKNSNSKKNIKNTLKRNIFKVLRPIISLSRKKMTKIEPKSVGIITDYGYSNYGNRLQNYALRTAINKTGYETYNICLNNNYFRLFGPFFELYSKIKNKSEKRTKMIKKAAILSGERNISFSYKYKEKSCLSFDKIVLGSDQIWNWSYHTYDLPFNLGLFCDKNKYNNIFSYAASIANNKISYESSLLFSSGLGKLKSISVREKKSQDLLREMGFETKIVCDPVLLLSKEEWDSAINKYKTQNKLPDRYSLKYVLTDGKNKNNCDFECIDVLNPDSRYFNGNHFDFINLIKNADLIITDSFHAVVFSIIFKKKVKFKFREDMASRFDYLFSLLGIKDFKEGIIDFSAMDYGRLESFISDSKNYLLDNI